MKSILQLFERRLYWIIVPFGLLLFLSLTEKKNWHNDAQPGYTKDDVKDTFNGFKEIETLFTPVPHNQGMTNDGKYLYISPDHHTIEKRNINDFTLLQSANHKDKIGGLFYDSERDEILTCSGQYITGGNAFISRINKNDLTKIETIDISAYTQNGVNAIVRLGDKIYVGETAVASDAKPKSWYVFDSDFNFIEKVFTHISDKGSYDWQDATVYNGKIYATDHNGFVFAFRISENGQLSSLGYYDSFRKYPEGIMNKDSLFLFWKVKEGIVSAKLK